MKKTEQERKIIFLRKEVNQMNFSKLSAGELDMFFTLIYIYKKQGNIEDGKLSQLRKIFNIKANTNKKIKEVLENIYSFSENNKITSPDVGVFKEQLFDYIFADEDKKTFSFKVNDKLDNMLSSGTCMGVKGGVLMFDLDVFKSIKGKYEKLIYITLVEYAGSNWVKKRVNDFLDRLNYPNSYPRTHKIHYLKKGIKSLNMYFPGIKVEIQRGMREIDDIIYVQWNKKDVYKLNNLRKNIKAV